MNLIGATVGNYQIVEPLGRGGMAEVYKAHHTELDVFRAIKFIRPEFADSEDFRARFQREARAIAQLDHPNIIHIYDFGEHDGLYYMVMRYVQGSNLKAALEDSGALPTDQALNWARQIASALAYAHERDVVHRDVKPENVLLDEAGNAVLADFGIAKLLAADTQMTQTGVGMGTPAYMAPEQAMGGEVTAAADVYSLTIMLYEMLTGEQPFSADTPIAVVVKAMHDPLPNPRALNPGIDDRLQALIFRGTAKKPEDRYGSAGLLLKALDELGGTPSSKPARDDSTLVIPPTSEAPRVAEAADASTSPPAEQTRRRNPIAAVLVILVLAVAAYFASQQDAELVEPAATSIETKPPVLENAKPRVERPWRDDEPRAGRPQPNADKPEQPSLSSPAAEHDAQAADVSEPPPEQTSGVQKPPPRSVVTDPRAQLQQACEMGIAKQCAELAALYESGIAGPKNPARAVALHAQACPGGEWASCRLAGESYYQGQVVARDPKRASELFSRACLSGGDAQSCTYLGILFKTGTGVDQQSVLAARYFERGCDAGSAQGCTNLGFAHLNGDGVPQAPGKAAAAFRAACESGHGEGCVGVGGLLWEGRGVKRDRPAARRAYSRACDQGYAYGCQLAER